MTLITSGLNRPAHGTKRLAPGGYHIMFTGLKQPLRKGETAKATLTFAPAGSLPVEFTVREVGASAPDAGKKNDDMKGMKM